MCRFKIRLIIALLTFAIGVFSTAMWLKFNAQNCKETKVAQMVSASVMPTSPTPPMIPLSEINLAKIEQIMPKGRVQDKHYNQLPTVDNLLAHGKDSIPFLISKLDDETELENRSIPYWYEQTVADVSFIILMDFFLDAKWKNSTIDGMKWDTFLGRGNDRDSTAESLLRNYISKYGRKKIKERWQKVWEKYKDNIYWIEEERCFRVIESDMSHLKNCG